MEAEDKLGQTIHLLGKEAPAATVVVAVVV